MKQRNKIFMKKGILYSLFIIHKQLVTVIIINHEENSGVKFDNFIGTRARDAGV